MHQVEINNFQGPLSLLLDLIEQNKLDITEVSLSEVTDQYLAKLDERRGELSGEELADFLLIAAKLLVIKSRALLPSLGLEEEGISLEEQLKMYKVYRDANKVVAGIIKQKNFSFGREPLKFRRQVSFSPPEKLTVKMISTRFKEVIASLERSIITLPKKTLKKVVSLGERIQDLRSLLATSAKFGFAEFIKSAKSRADVVVSFLALLELIKQRELGAEQEGARDDILIKQYSKMSS
ncbi:MAG: hypothetical protein A3H70_05460 [Candidatus Komeilibacteria bacterium RIFCSPLOWO2_02_FULL_48_11]|uniref:Segregation and condensation protein A n=1 Tax=Candidatus Komeilibacteria bacterium RIFCSPLOWO2_02_FULL_48_11 TaxID=1798553 RepID=A0A1G2BVI6_9BACT|nr:MAG: hypothetical protein A3H70_05460 [Candidatus Komeilibacteria bacterium RIFCSPLOWO2_02_FULL_48_11]